MHVLVLLYGVHCIGQILSLDASVDRLQYDEDVDFYYRGSGGDHDEEEDEEGEEEEADHGGDVEKANSFEPDDDDI